MCSLILNNTAKRERPGECDSGKSTKQGDTSESRMAVERCEGERSERHDDDSNVDNDTERAKRQKTDTSSPSCNTNTVSATTSAHATITNRKKQQNRNMHDSNLDFSV